jgi:hypothetical protein
MVRGRAKEEEGKKKVSKREATAQTDLEERKKKQARKTASASPRARALALHKKPDTPASSIPKYRIPTPSSLESRNLFSSKLKY